MPSSFYMTPSEILLGTIKIWSIFWTKFHSKICKSWYYCFNYTTSKSATRHNRFAIFILYETSILLGRIKIWSIFWTKFHSKICKSWYYCFNYITSKSGTRHNRFAILILYDSFRNFIRNNKNMVNILNKISLKNMQIVILLLQLHHV